MVELDEGLLKAYVAILVMSVGSIIVGARRSLWVSERAEVMTSKDAALFPVLGSFVLFGLYMLFRYFDRELINYILSGYFLLLGVFAVAQTIRPLMMRICPTEYVNTSLQVTWWDGTHTPKFTGADAVGVAFGAVVAVWYSYTKFWIANNIFGLCFAVTAIEYMSLGGFAVAAVLLCGLFVYDVFWVFGTDVMVTVAKSVDHPIKLVWPKGGLWAKDYSMIGLGDLVLPGILIALLLRFDRHRNKGGDIYFHVCTAAYTLGLVLTVVVMHTFQAAQPALLYLVPATLGSTLLLARSRGEIDQLFAYSEEPKSETTSTSTTTTTTPSSISSSTESAGAATETTTKATKKNN